MDQQLATYDEYEHLSEIHHLGAPRLRALAAALEVPLDGVEAGPMSIAVEIIATIEVDSIIATLTDGDLAAIGRRLIGRPAAREVVARLRRRGRVPDSWDLSRELGPR